MSSFNFASIEAGASIVDFSTVVDNCDPSNVLDGSNDMIWLSEKGLPQWLCVSLKDVQVQEEAIIRTVGWRCWHPYKTNPRVVKLHVSPDRLTFREWDTFIASNPRGLTQLFCCTPINLVIYQYIAFEIVDTFGGDQTYINSLYLLADEVSQSPLISLGEEVSTPASSVQGDPIMDTDEENVPFHSTVSGTLNHGNQSHHSIVNSFLADDSSAGGSVDTGALLSQLERALGFGDGTSFQDDDDSSQDSALLHADMARTFNHANDVEFLVPERDEDEPTEDESTTPESESEAPSSGRASPDMHQPERAIVESKSSLLHEECRSAVDASVLEVTGTTKKPEAAHFGDLGNEMSNISAGASITSRGSHTSTRLRNIENQLGTLTEAINTFKQTPQHRLLDSHRQRLDCSNISESKISESFASAKSVDTSGSLYVSSDADYAEAKDDSRIRGYESESVANSVDVDHKESSYFKEDKEEKKQHMKSESLSNSIDEKLRKEAHELVNDVMERIEPCGSESLCTEYIEDVARSSPEMPERKTEPRQLENRVYAAPTPGRKHRDHRYHITSPAAAKKVAPEFSASESDSSSGDSGGMENLSVHVSDSLSIYEDNDPTLSENDNEGEKVIVGEEAEAIDDSEFTSTSDSVIESIDAAGDKRNPNSGGAEVSDEGKYSSGEKNDLHAGVRIVDVAAIKYIPPSECSEVNSPLRSGVEAPTVASTGYIETEELQNVLSPKPNADHSGSVGSGVQRSDTPAEGAGVVQEDRDKRELFHRVESIEGLLQAVMLKLDENARILTTSSVAASPPKKLPEQIAQSEPLAESEAEVSPESRTADLKSKAPHIVADICRKNKSDRSSCVWGGISAYAPSCSTHAVRGHHEKLQSLHKPGLIHRPRKTESPPRNNERYLASAAATQRHLAQVGLSGSSRRKKGDCNSEPLRADGRDAWRKNYLSSAPYFEDTDSGSDTGSAQFESSQHETDDNRICMKNKYMTGGEYHDNRSYQDLLSRQRGMSVSRSSIKSVDVGKNQLREPKTATRRVMYGDERSGRTHSTSQRANIHDSRYTSMGREEESVEKTSPKVSGVRISSGSLYNIAQTLQIAGTNGTDVEIADIVRRLHAKVLKRTLKEAELRALRDGTSLQLQLKNKSQHH